MKRILVFLILSVGVVFAGDLETARGLIDSSKYKEAKLLLAPMQKNPRTEAQALVLLTEVSNYLDEYEDGVDYGKRAVELLQSDSNAHYQYAVALRIKMSSVSKARAMFSLKTYKKALVKAIELDPKNIDARVEQVGFLTNAPGFAGGDLAEAREKVVEVQKLDWEIGMEMLAEIEIQDERPDKAIVIYKKMVAKNPDAVGIRIRLVYLLQAQGSFDDAEHQLLFLSENENPAIALTAKYQRARSRILGKYEQEKAVELLLEYLEAPIDDLGGIAFKSAANWRLGNAYEQLGRKTEARKAYETALRLNPDDKEAKKSLKALGK